MLGASNLSRPGGSSSVGGDGSSGKSGSGKKDGLNQRLLQESSLDNASNSDSMSTGSGGGGWHSREQSPSVQGKSRLQNGESSSEAGTALTLIYYCFLYNCYCFDYAIDDF